MIAASLAACADMTGGTGKPVADAQAGQPHEMLNAVLWQKTSAEYEAAARQSFTGARRSLDRALSDRTWTAALEQTGAYADLPPAIVIDLDETVLDNTPYQERIVLRDGDFSRERFRAWCKEANAPAVPGAKEFLQYADGRGVAVFYVTARSQDERSCTLTNLQRLGLPLPRGGERLLLQSEGGKTDHRRQIAARYRILLLVGDNLEDFVDGGRVAPDKRRKLGRIHADRWGRQWIILPNPMYGQWESAWFGFDDEKPRGLKLEKKRRGLQAAR